MNALSKLTSRYTISAVLALLLIIWLISSYVVSQRLDILTQTLQLQLADQQTLLVSIAEITARNGADSITESIVRDCPIDSRLRFDGLLGQLDSGLALSELRELDSLFVGCASFYAERKAVMVARLDREVEIFEAFATQLDVVTTADSIESYQVAQWRELAAFEHAQSEAASSLVSAQKAIINQLLDGKDTRSPEIMDILQGVQETKEAELFAQTKAADLRQQLIDL